jgi:O-acetyl-ADP-ribose deacetylase (regulator of RNase III)
MNRVLAGRALPGGPSLQLVQGDLTAEASDAIVNAANPLLQHGAGVAGAILRRGGAIIQHESDEWVRTHGPVSHAQPAWTSGGRLAAKYVIHAVGPVWGEGDEEAKLEAAVRGSLEIADQLGVTSISIPAISTGVFGFPKDRAAKIILSAIGRYFSGPKPGIQMVRLVLFDEATVSAFQEHWQDGQLGTGSA